MAEENESVKLEAIATIGLTDALLDALGELGDSLIKMCYVPHNIDARENVFILIKLALQLYAPTTRTPAVKFYMPIKGNATAILVRRIIKMLPTAALDDLYEFSSEQYDAVLAAWHKDIVLKPYIDQAEL